MSRMPAIAAGLVLVTACGVGVGAVRQAAAATAPRCASVTIALRTRTGHEADLPVKVCGGIGRTGTYQCDIAKGGIVAGAKLECARIPQPAAAPTPTTRFER